VPASRPKKAYQPASPVGESAVVVVRTAPGRRVEAVAGARVLVEQHGDAVQARLVGVLDAVAVAVDPDVIAQQRGDQAEVQVRLLLPPSEGSAPVLRDGIRDDAAGAVAAPSSVPLSSLSSLSFGSGKAGSGFS
jgi:hypothetical protein